jgi:outer membrane lipoprotein-sorting protein
MVRFFRQNFITIDKEVEQMKKLFYFSLAIILIVIMVAIPALSQEEIDKAEKTAKAKKILDDMVEAQGGADILKSITDTTTTGTMEMIQMGLSGTITMYQKEPNKMRWDMEFMGMVVTQAYDGVTAWMINPQTGSAEEMPEEFAEDFTRQALGIDSLLNPEKYGITYVYEGKEMTEGKEYIVLKQTFEDGFVITLYIDPDTYLPFKTKSKTYNQMGVEVEAETYLSDYMESEGMQVPYTITVFQDGEEFITISLTDITYNSGLEDTFFSMDK